MNHAMATVRRTMLAASMCILPASLPLAAQHTLDQQSPGGGFGVGFTSFWQGQTFRSSAANVSGGGFDLRFGCGTYAVAACYATTATVHLWDGDPGAGGSLLAAGTGVIGGPGYFDVFWTPVLVDPSVTYWLLIGGSAADVAWTQVGPMGRCDPQQHACGPLAPYAAGNAVYAASGAESGFSATGYDLGFRTWTDLSPSTVPEPTTLALLALGLLPLVLRRLRTSA